ncbi:DUF1036 domain-containing protein [Ancylobacter gelatini]|uniref:DUF1036 domain-containing protein n=1 Tax=Ancylobacter gelatini TaxID=2919920 RepID=UPI003CCA4DB4
MIFELSSSTSERAGAPARAGLKRRAGGSVLAALMLAPVLATLAPTPAAADFRLCNRSGSRIGIALGYKDGNIWATEGWWNIAPKSCETLLRGDLVARFYYVYAIDYDLGGEWAGKAFMCTREKEFTIRGIEDCLARGFDRTGFFEVDTREQKSWTVQLTEPDQAATPRVGMPPLPPPKAP